MQCINAILFKSDLALTAAKPPVSELCISYIEVFCYLMFSDTPINKAPAIGTQDLNLYRLFRLVRNFGGYNKVSLPFDERSTGLPPTIPSTDLPTTTTKSYLLRFGNQNTPVGNLVTTGLYLTKNSYFSHNCQLHTFF